MNRAQGSTVIKVVGAGIAAILTLASYYLYLEHGTLANDVPEDHLTAALGAFLVAQPWAAVALIVLVVGGVAFALGVLTGHIGEDAKRWTKGSRVPAVLLAALLLPGCKTVERVLEDPSRLCPPNHVLTTEGCIVRPPEISEPPATPPPAPPTPSPTSTPAPEQPPATPTPTPRPEPVPAPTATPAPAPLPPATPTPTPKPGLDPCLRAVREAMDQHLAYGHLTKRAGTTWYCNEDGHRGPECHDYATGAKVDPNTGAIVRPGPDAAWYGVECAPAPPPVVTPTPLPAPTPTPGAYGCGGVVAAKVGINVKSQPKQLKASDIAAGKRQATEAECRLDADGIEPGAICILLADASVRGPKGSAPLVPSTEAHLGWLPGCHWIVRPKWEQQAPSDDLRVDGGVRHWLDDGSTNARPSWELGDYPPHRDQPFGSLFRAEFDFASTIRIRACWPPDVPDPLCSDWFEVTHR